MYKLKNVNGRVNVLFKAGNDFVSNSIPVEEANRLISVGNIIESDREDYPLHIDIGWYFETTETEAVKDNKAETDTDNTKTDEANAQYNVEIVKAGKNKAKATGKEKSNNG